MSTPVVEGGGNVEPNLVVEIAGLDKTFNPDRANAVAAIAGLDLSVGPREFVSVIGPSGCGKSTLLRLVGGLTAPTAGTVAVNGKSAGAARQDRDYGMVFQAAGLLDWRSAARNVELPLELMGWPKSRRRARVAEMLELVELSGFASYHPGGTLRGHAAAGVDRPGTVVRAVAAADGRTVRRLGRDDPRAHAGRVAEDLAGDRHDGDLRHAFHSRGRVPVHEGGGHVAPPGSDRRGDTHRTSRTCAAGARHGRSSSAASRRCGGRCAPWRAGEGSAGWCLAAAGRFRRSLPGPLGAGVVADRPRRFRAATPVGDRPGAGRERLRGVDGLPGHRLHHSQPGWPVAWCWVLSPPWW